MIRTRQRRLAWMFMLVLVLELALLSCASMHLSDHACSDRESCAICSFVRAGLRRVAVVAIAASALTGAIAIQTGARVPRRFIIADSPILRRVRLND